MSIKGKFIHKKYFLSGLILVSIFLICGTYYLYYHLNRFNIPEKDYVVTKVKLSLPEEIDQFFESIIGNQINSQIDDFKNSTYIQIKAQEIALMTEDGPIISPIDRNNQVSIFNDIFTLQRSLVHSTELVSLDENFTLILRPAYPSEIQNIEQRIQKKRDSIKAQIDAEIALTATLKKRISDESLISDYLGLPVSLSDNIYLKVPLSGNFHIEKAFLSELPRNLVKIINPSLVIEEKLTLLRSKYSKTDAYFITMNTENPPIDFTTVPQESIIYRESDGLIYLDAHSNIYTAAYQYYDMKNNQYAFAYYQDPDANLYLITTVYNILRTLNPLYLNEVPRFTYLSLLPEEFKKQTGLEISSQFRDFDFFEDFKKEMIKVINGSERLSSRYTNKEHDDLKEIEEENSLLYKTGYKFDQIFFADNRYLYQFPINGVIHYASLHQALDSFKKEDPQGKAFDNVFIWSTPSKYRHFSLLIEDTGITFEIRIGSSLSSFPETIIAEKFAILFNIFLKSQLPLNWNMEPL